MNNLSRWQKKENKLDVSNTFERMKMCKGHVGSLRLKK
jgi:hypothetical protein